MSSVCPVTCDMWHCSARPDMLLMCWTLG